MLSEQIDNTRRLALRLSSKYHCLKFTDVPVGDLQVASRSGSQDRQGVYQSEVIRLATRADHTGANHKGIGKDFDVVEIE